MIKNKTSSLLSLIPKPNYVLRSHSSANDRCCIKCNDEKLLNLKLDKTRFEYSKEFFDACYSVGAEYAVPFASNMACLHKETFSYNSILNFSDYVVEDFKAVKLKYKELKCKLIIHSENDFRCPVEQGEQLFSNLKRRNIDSAMIK